MARPLRHHRQGHSQAAERYPQAACAPHAVASGGSIIGWGDEAWKGRVIDSVKTDGRTEAMQAILDAFVVNNRLLVLPVKLIVIASSSFFLYYLNVL